MAEVNGNPADDVSTSILNNYDDRIIKAVQQAFDIFDINNKNEILAVELERVFCSLNQNISIDDITDLIEDIDKKHTGMLRFNNFMTYIIPYLRGRYKQLSIVSLDALKNRFDRLDLNNDGTLNRYEFKHVINQSNHYSTSLTKKENDILVDYLDVDKDEIISWNEFSAVCRALEDESSMSTLNPLLCSALRKV